MSVYVVKFVFNEKNIEKIPRCLTNIFFIYCFSGVLVNLHHSQASNGNTGECGLINIDAIQQVVAAKWAVDVINNQSLPHELRIGRSTSTAVIRPKFKFPAKIEMAFSYISDDDSTNSNAMVSRAQ